MESESEESERFHFLPIPLDSVAYVLMKTSLSELEAEAEEPTNHNACFLAL